MEATSAAILVNINDYKSMVDNYVSILEKTNNQLSLWFNPYGIIIGILTLLIAAMAITVSVLLWKNSQEQKKRVNDFFNEQEKNTKKFRQEKEKEVQVAKKNLNKLIAKYQKQLLTAGEENKKQIEEAINSFEKEKAVISAYTFSPSKNFSFLDNYGDCSYSFPLWDKKETTCSNCGRKFKFYDELDSSVIGSMHNSSISYTMGSGKKEVFCTFCGTKNIVF